jgi:hypothetical protein
MVERLEPTASAPTIIARRGSHRLVCCGRGFAVIECRNGKVYNLADGKRRGFASTADGIAAAVGDDWRDEASARRLFDDIAQRGEALAQRIW